MRQPIIDMWFHPSIKELSYSEFSERFKSQLTDEEIRRFAAQLEIKPPGKKEISNNKEKEPE